MGERNTTQQEIRRRLLTPDEAMRLDPDHEVVFVAGQQPIYASKIRYFNENRLRSRSAIAPPCCSNSSLSRVPVWRDIAEYPSALLPRDPGGLSGPIDLGQCINPTESPNDPRLQIDKDR